MILATGCDDRAAPPVTFYWWQTTYEPGPKCEKLLAYAKEEPVYIRYFDLDWNEYQQQSVIRGKLNQAKKLPQPHIPVVFITNRTFQSLSPDSLHSTVQKVYAQLKTDGWREKGEIQFDCDWSNTTREPFFQFLNQFRGMAKDSVRISATIRLHQIKYPEKTGVPPVDQGTLMFYNMGDLELLGDQNSILDLEVGEQYIGKLPDYPLELDVALPLFNWLVVYRMNRIVNLIPEVTVEVLAADSLMEKSGENRVKVTQSHYFRGVYLYKDDQLRLERVTQADLEKAADLLADYEPENGFRRLIFYHLSESIAQNYPTHDLEKIRNFLR